MTVMHEEERRLEPSAEEMRSDAQPGWVVAELPEQYADIARQMVVSVNTLRTHTKRIYTKLGVTNRRAAVQRGHDLELLPGRR